MKVAVSLHSVQTVDGEREHTDVVADGDLECSSDGAWLRYEESLEDGGTATVVITVDARRVIVERCADVSSYMILERGKRHPCRYDTPYGSLELYTTAHRTEFSFKDHTGVLQLAYTLDMQGANIEQEIEITIKEVSPC